MTLHSTERDIHFYKIKIVKVLFFVAERGTGSFTLDPIFKVEPNARTFESS